MNVHTDYLVFNTSERQEFIRITDRIAEIVAASGVREGMVLVSAMQARWISDRGSRSSTLSSTAGERSASS